MNTTKRLALALSLAASLSMMGTAPSHAFSLNPFKAVKSIVKTVGHAAEGVAKGVAKGAKAVGKGVVTVVKAEAKVASIVAKGAVKVATAPVKIGINTAKGVGQLASGNLKGLNTIASAPIKGALDIGKTTGRTIAQTASIQAKDGEDRHRVGHQDGRQHCGNPGPYGSEHRAHDGKGRRQRCPRLCQGCDCAADDGPQHRCAGDPASSLNHPLRFEEAALWRRLFRLGWCGLFRTHDLCDGRHSIVCRRRLRLYRCDIHHKVFD